MSMYATSHYTSANSYSSAPSSSSGSSYKAYSSTLRKSRILIFSLLYHVGDSLSDGFLAIQNLVYFIEMLQIISITLEPAFFSFGNNYIDNGVWVLSRLRNVMPAIPPVPATTAAISIVIVYLGLLLLLGGRLAILVEHGELSGSPGGWLKLWGFCTVIIHQMIYLPILNILFSSLQCGITYIAGRNLSGIVNSYQHVADNLICSASESVVFVVLATVILFVVIFTFGAFALVVPGYSQNKRFKHFLFSMTFNRLYFFLFLIKTCATIYIQFSGPMPLEIRTGVYHWVLLALFSVLYGSVLYYLPFTKRTTNFIVMAFLAICAWSSLCAFITTETTQRFQIFIVYMVLLVPIAALSTLIGFLRVRKFYKAATAEEGDEVVFRHPFEVELYARPYINYKPADHPHEKVISLFWRGMQQYPSNLDIQIPLMQFLAYDKHNFQLMTSVKDKIRSSNAHVDIKFLLFCLEKQRISVALSMDGGAEEVSKNLLRANVHGQRAKLLIKSFWESLLHEEELLMLPTIVAKLEREETKADVIYKRLRTRFPHNVAVMRHYALFLEEVKNDPELAYTLFKAADEHESETAQQHSRREQSTAPVADEIELEGLEKTKGKGKGDNVNIELSTIGEKKKKKDKGSKRETDDSPSPVSDDPDRFGSIRRRAPTFNLDDQVYEQTPRGKDKSTFHNVELPMAKRMSKYELLRYRRYRAQAEVTRSHSVWKMTFAINLTLLVLLLNMVIVFATTMGVLQEQRISIEQLYDMVITRRSVAASVSSTFRTLRFTATNNSEQYQNDLTTMRTSISWLKDNTLSLYQANAGDAEIDYAWASRLYPVYQWTRTRELAIGTGYILQQENVLDMLAQFTFWMQQSLTTIGNPNNADNLWNTTSGRFMLDNGLGSIFTSVFDLVEVYEEKSLTTTGVLQKLTAALLPLSFVTLGLLLWFLLRAAIVEIQQERISILKLFLAIPKDNILNIVGLMRNAEENEEEDLFAANEDEVSTFNTTVDLNPQDQNAINNLMVLKSSRLSMLKNFFVKFLISLVIVFVMVLVASIIVLTSVNNFNRTITDINLAGQRRALTSFLDSCVLSMAYTAQTQRNLPLAFNQTKYPLTNAHLRDLVQVVLRNISAADDALKFGGKYGGGVRDYPYLVDLEYNYNCRSIPGYSYTCTGINSLVAYMSIVATTASSLPDSSLSFTSSQVALLSDLINLQLNFLLSTAVDYYRDVAFAAINSVSVAVITIFVLVFPILVVINFVLRPMVVRIKQEHQRTIRMLLMIPLNVIDNTKAIKEYLDSMVRSQQTPSWYRIDEKKKKDAVTTHNEPLLQAVMKEGNEAIMVISTEGTIETINPGTERMFGFEKRDLLGHRISTIFTEAGTDAIIFYIMQQRPRTRDRDVALGISGPKVNANGEVPDLLYVDGRKKDGEIFPCSLSFTPLKMNSKLYYGTHVRDITYLRTVERQMEAERKILSGEQKKLQDLLLNVFPKSIAEQLLIKGDEYKPHLIAEEFKEATILFADIVGFTQMCADLEPAVLLLILNGIFSEWDVLVDKYNVQKIKTIGDCFMVAGGVPERMVDHVERVIDFAMEMRDALHRYNETCHLLKSRSLALNLRIGINTGPVVAGIIGKTRMCFDLWGDAVNVASRMESTSIVGRIQVSQNTFNRVKNKYEFEERGMIEVKGKGAMLTYLLVGPRFQRTSSGKVIDVRFAGHLKPTNSPPMYTYTSSFSNKDSNNNNNNNNDKDNTNNNNNSNNNNNNNNSTNPNPLHINIGSLQNYAMAPSPLTSPHSNERAVQNMQSFNSNYNMQTQESTGSVQSSYSQQNSHRSSYTDDEEKDERKPLL